MMYKIAPITLLLALSFSCSDQPAEVQPSTIKEEAVEFTSEAATVYTTAKDTDQRLQQGGAFNFEPGEQPLETELSIFVNPNQTFQTLVGIGDAITDASAEVFAKLPEDKQEELPNAY